MIYPALKRQEMVSVIEGKGAASRVPVVTHLWIHPNSFGDRKEAVLDIMRRYPSDAAYMPFIMPEIFEAPVDNKGYRWANTDAPKDIGSAIDSQIFIKDWSQLPGILKDFPDPEYKALMPQPLPEDGCYRLGGWNYLLFERFWSLRGMENAFMDFYNNPEEVKRLFRALTDFYIRCLERGKKELNLDGVFTTDDVGAQTGLMFSPAIFREFFKPYYKEMIDAAHKLGMHFWFHCCGNIEKIIPELIEIGMDVLHPIQKYTMDERKIAEKFGKDICIWAGMDVQQTMPWGTEQDVRKEVRFMIDAYQRPEGRVIIGAGNGVNQDCPVPNLEAFFNEVIIYGTEKVKKGIK